MILTCPSCSASYNVPNDAIGVEGRQVRCKKCHHEWFQEGEKKALEDLINLIQSTEIEVDNIEFDDNRKKSKPSKSKKTKDASGKKFAGILQKIIPARLKNYLFTGDNRGFLSHFASFMVAMAVFSGLLLALVSFRAPITHIMPSLTSVYEAAGFPLSHYARINPEEALIIDRLMLNADGGKPHITGSLINITSQNVKVPAFKLDYLGGDEKVLHEGIQVLPIAALGKEGTYSFSIAVPEDAPKSLSSVKITFAEIK